MRKDSSDILSQDKENELIDGLINNHDSAYEALVHRYSVNMYAVSSRFFSSEDDAQECLQKAFIQVFKNISTFNKNSSLSTWLHRITVNEALMIIRQRKRQKTTSLEEFFQRYNEYGEREGFSDNLDVSLGQHLHQGLDRDYDNNIETIFEKNETKLSLNEFIYQLPEKYCNVLLLRDIQEISTKETAEILAISEASVKTQLHRARLLLKAVLEQQDKRSLENNWKVN